MEGKKYDKSQLFQLLFIWGLCVVLIFGSGIDSKAQKSSKGIVFDHPSGFYDSPLTLGVTTVNENAKLLYTTDGSNPATSSSAIEANHATNIRIDPEIVDGRPATPAFLVRAVATIADTAITEHVSATYIFPDKVKQQSYPGGDWPQVNINGQHLDFDMDINVVENPLYVALMDDSWTDIPSISIITDNDNLFSSSTGIYVNAQNHGKGWERPCSIELINVDGNAGFFENAGLRIRGGFSRNPNFPKHAFRLFFREEYGTDKLRYPLFEDEGVKEFDKIDLRCAQNYSWSNGHGEHNTFVREVFARDTQGEMGHPYTRSRYYHLFLNGMYWGLYQTQERSEAWFAQSYLGGDREDYDVIKVNTDYYQYEIEATDGNMESWKTVWNMSQQGFSSNSNYFLLQGKNQAGGPLPGAEVFVNIDNLIDYMLIVFYTGSFDAPISQFLNNDRPNNFYAIDSREDKSDGFRFFVHDTEHSMMIDPVTVGQGIYENRVNVGTVTGDRRMDIREFKYFNPQWLHFKLSANAEYRMQFADRAAIHLIDDGVFTVKKANKRFNKRAAQIELAIIAESARWGDTRRSPAYTKDNAWIPELNAVRNNFFPRRPQIVIEQLKDAGLFTSLGRPHIIVADTILYSTTANFSGRFSLTLANPNNSGEIVYTLNGQDPRLMGGMLSREALSVENGYALDFSNSTVLKSRILNGNEWSALRTLTLISDVDDMTNLKITEIHYHPEEQINGLDTLHSKDLEFLEFKNIGENSLNLSGLRIDSAVQYLFPENTILAPGQFYVVAAKPSKFYEKYGLQASGNFKGNLSNSGERLVLLDKNNDLLIDFSYSDKAPWPDKADGKGPSIVSTTFNPTGEPSNDDYWRASIYDGGSPFRDDELITAINENTKPLPQPGIIVFPNPASSAINISAPSLPKNARLAFKLYDLNGQVLLAKKVVNHGTISLEKHCVSPGIKLISVFHEQLYETAKIIVE